MADSDYGAPEQNTEAFDYDLRPDSAAGQNIGVAGVHPEKAGGVRTAYDIKDLHRRFQQFEDDELKGIPVMPDGSRLEQDATYIDLRKRTPKEFTARGDMEAGSANWYVPKAEVDYQLWNRLIGVDNPERLGEADDGATDTRAAGETATTRKATAGAGGARQTGTTGSAAKATGGGAKQPPPEAQPKGGLFGDQSNDGELF
jgi:hypothetical protein